MITVNNITRHEYPNAHGRRCILAPVGGVFKFSIVAAICCFFYGCYDVKVNYDLSITNKSKMKISLLYSNHVQKNLTENNIAYYIRDDKIVKPDSSLDITILGGREAWHDYMEEGKTKRLFLYVFSTDTLTKYNNSFSIDDLVHQHKYLKLFNYSENDLNKTNWKIVFKM